MKNYFFFEDKEFAVLYNIGISPNKIQLKEKSEYILLLFIFLFLDSLIKLVNYFFISEPPNAKLQVSLIIQTVIYLFLFLFMYLVRTYELVRLKSDFLADLLYFFFLIITRFLFLEIEVEIINEPSVGKIQFFYEGMKISWIETLYFLCLYSWKMKLFSLLLLVIYLFSRIFYKDFLSTGNFLIFFFFILLIMLEERYKRLHFLKMNESCLKELPKGKSLNSKITLINEKEKSAISDQILDHIEEGILVVDEKANLIKMNDSLIKIFREFKIDFNEVVNKIFNARIVKFSESPDFILNVVSPSEIHLSPDVKTKICNSKEHPKEKRFSTLRARTSNVFGKNDFSIKKSNMRPNTLTLDFETEKKNLTSHPSQCSSNNQGINMQVRKTIELLIQKVASLKVNKDYLDQITIEKSEDSYKIDCDIVFEELQSLDSNTIKSNVIYSSKFKFHLKIMTTSFKDELRIILILKEKKNEIEKRNLALQNENKSKTLAFVSHEMRTPLNCIVGMLTVLENFVGPDIFEKFVIPAVTSAKHLLNLLNDLLDAAQIQAGKFKLVFVEFDLKALLTDALMLINIQAKPKGIELILEWDNNLAHYINSDPNRIRQIIINLLGNALKFTQKGSIRLVTQKNNINNTLIHIRVIDTGVGIKEENKKKLFTAFGKLEEDENEYLNSQGVGLGLLISNVLAKNLGPSAKSLIETGINLSSGLNVKSEYGHGTEFNFLIENKNCTDIYDEADVEVKIEDLNQKLLLQKPYFLHEKKPFQDVKSLENRIIRKLLTKKSESQKEISAESLPSEADDLNPNKAQNDLKRSKKSFENQIELSNRGSLSQFSNTISLNKYESGPEKGKSLFYMNKDFDQKETNNHQSLNEIIYARFKVFKKSTRNLSDVVDNEEKIKLILDLNLIKKCNCPDLLICDDNIFNISVLKALLEVYKFRVDSSMNGEEAISKVKSLYENSDCCKFYKLIFMDVEMPIKNGYEASISINSYYKILGVDPPIIVSTSGHVEKKQQKKMLESGMTEILMKPILRGALLDLLVRKLFNVEKYPPNLYPIESLNQIFKLKMSI